MIKVRLNPDGTFRVVSWSPYMYMFNWKTIRHFKTVEETKEYIKELTKTDRSKLDIKPDAHLKLYSS